MPRPDLPNTSRPAAPRTSRTTRRPTLLLAAVLGAALTGGLGACTTDDSGGGAADAGDVGGDARRDGDDDGTRDGDATCDEGATFTCCSGDVEFDPVCSAGGYSCPSGTTQAAFGGCAGDVGHGDDLDAGGDDASGCAANPPVPTSDPSVQTASFVITNDTETDRFVADEGWFCTAFGLQQQVDSGFAGVSLTLGFQCGCECPFPGPAGVQHYVRLGPGESTTLTWDARRLGTVRSTIDCEAEGWVGAGCVNELAGYLSQAEPDVYRVTVPVGEEGALGPDCTASDEGADCVPTGGWDPTALPNPATMCPAVATVSATFTLPAEGNVTVDLPIE